MLRIVRRIKRQIQDISFDKKIISDLKNGIEAINYDS